MVERIHALLHARPFKPFRVRTGDGREYAVPTGDHAAVNPKRTHVVIFTDDDRQFTLAALHLTAVDEDLAAAGPS